MDLLANRDVWHVYGRGLIIPVASEGFRKYTLEYNNPWRGISKLVDHEGRVLGASAATLRFPWQGETDAATVVVRLNGVSKAQRLSLRLNGKPIKNLNLAAGWQVVSAAVPANLLRKGENELGLAVARKGALFHSIEVMAGAVVPDPAEVWPAQSPAVSGERPGLGNFARMTMLLEVPRDAYLVVTTGAAAPTQARLTIRPEGQAATVLLDEAQTPGQWKPHTLALAHWAGQLVELELSGGARWVEPRILLAAVPSRPRPKPMRNAILMIGDALRADELVLNAPDSRVRTPRITAAATQGGGVVFLNMLAASPSSPPSHASIQSGTVPRTNGIGGDTSKLAPNTPMISAHLRKAQIATGYTGDNGFAMNRLKAASNWTAYHLPSQEGKGGGCPTLIKEMLAFADEQTKAGKRWFISSVAFEPHTAYVYHPGITENYYKGEFDPAIGKSPDGVILSAIVGGKLSMNPARWAQLRGLYDGEVEFMDGCFGALVDGLKARGQADNTAILLTGDHGEGFFEHGCLGHAFGHWREVTHVPLVLYVPGLSDKLRKIDTVVSHLDIAPTISDLLGVAPDERMQGQSLLPMILRQGPWVPRVVPSEYGRSYGLRAARLHYIVDYSGKEMLYDTSTDPQEKTELKNSRPMALRYMRDNAGFYLAHRARWRMSTWGTLNNHAAGFVEAAGQAPAVAKK